MSKYIGSFDGGIRIEVILHSEPTKHQSPIAAIVLDGPLHKTTKKTVENCAIWLKDVFQQIVDEHKMHMVHTFDIYGRLETWVFHPNAPAQQIS